MELGITLTLFVLTTLQIGLRLHTRIFLSRAVGWDDWFAVASMVWIYPQSLKMCDVSDSRSRCSQLGKLA